MPHLFVAPEPAAVRRFMSVSRAYEVLSDEDKRREYDRLYDYLRSNANDPGKFIEYDNFESGDTSRRQTADDDTPISPVSVRTPRPLHSAYFFCLGMESKFRCLGVLGLRSESCSVFPPAAFYACSLTFFDDRQVVLSIFGFCMFSVFKLIWTVARGTPKSRRKKR